jgi:hypothetical protein
MIPNWSIRSCRFFCFCNIFLAILLSFIGASIGLIISQMLFAAINAGFVWFAEWHNAKNRFLEEMRRIKMREE